MASGTPLPEGKNVARADFHQDKPASLVDRVLPTGDEAGSAPEDRGYRPDVEGLRAVAILLVVLLHAGVPHLEGGIIGVDVFFVVSGFVISGLLLREQQAANRIAFLPFYARRARRLLPAAALVIVVSLIATALLADHRTAVLVASDSRWSALFLANFHMTTVTPNVLLIRDTPVGAYWSLAVEEQFYLVYPAFFTLIMLFSMRWSPRKRLAIGLVAIAVISFLASIATSVPGHFAAYNSPFTRAWELAIGGLVAVGTAQLQRIPPTIAAIATWVGLFGIIVSGLFISARLALPGYVAALPVLSTALVIAGGTPMPRRGAESLLRLPPIAWLGRWSYSWYLWHLAIFVLAAYYAHTTVETSPIVRRLLLASFALVLAAITYYLVENPIRHSKWLSRSPRATMAGAALLVASCVALTYAF